MLGIIHGTVCPRCGSGTHRTRTPMRLRLIRALVPGTVTRRCNSRDCRWRGLAYQSDEAGRKRRRTTE